MKLNSTKIADIDNPVILSVFRKCIALIENSGDLASNFNTNTFRINRIINIIKVI